MLKISVHNLKGEKVEDMKLNADVFDVADNDELVHQVYVAMSANRRVGSAHTKTRSARRGGGKKPWKQKGTGNARTGSIRNPIWRGGGVIFGPTKDRNYSKKINAKVKQKVLKIVLSSKVRDGKMIVVDSLVLSENKTKVFAQTLKNLDVKSSALVGFTNDEVQYYRAVRNVSKVNGVPVDQINTFDLLNTETLLISKGSLEYIEKTYGKEVSSK